MRLLLEISDTRWWLAQETDPLLAKDDNCVVSTYSTHYANLIDTRESVVANFVRERCSVEGSVQRFFVAYKPHQPKGVVKPSRDLMAYYLLRVQPAST